MSGQIAQVNEFFHSAGFVLTNFNKKTARQGGPFKIRLQVTKKRRDLKGVEREGMKERLYF
ncbi:hypothetical protein GCM10027347_33030 [Larkinella harenae]